jgi:hypothetical protein
MSLDFSGIYCSYILLEELTYAVFTKQNAASKSFRHFPNEAIVESGLVRTNEAAAERALSQIRTLY